MTRVVLQLCCWYGCGLNLVGGILFVHLGVKDSSSIADSGVVEYENAAILSV